MSRAPFDLLRPWSRAQFAALVYDEARGQGCGYANSLDIVADQLREYGYDVPSRRALERWTGPSERPRTVVPEGDREYRARLHFSILRQRGTKYDDAIEQVAAHFAVDGRTLKRWL